VPPEGVCRGETLPESSLIGSTPFGVFITNIYNNKDIISLQ
jgi:hypothetical protein